MVALLARLDRETRRYHSSVTSGWRRLLEPLATPATYQQQLVHVYGFEAPLEAAIAYTPGLATVLDARRRMRSGLIATDLLALAISASEIAVLPQCMIAPFRTPSEALGWLYVSERETLFHDPVRRHLLARFPRLARATNYLSAASDARWDDFLDALERVAETTAESQQIVSAAHDAFHCAVRWYTGTAQPQAAAATAT